MGVLTPQGEFEPRLLPVGDAVGASDTTIPGDSVWFFFASAIESRDPNILATAFDLHHRLTGQPAPPQATLLDSSCLERIQRDLEQAVHAGRIVFEQLPYPVPRVRRPEDAVPHSSEPPSLDENQRRPVHFDVLFADEFGVPIQGEPFDVVFFYEGRSQSVTSDGSGRAVLDTQGTSSTAWVRLADQAAENALRQALVSIWDAAPRVAGRESQVLVEGDGVAVAFLKSSSRDGEELAKREFRLTADEPYTISLQPYVRLAELVGLFFEKNKCFLLPSAMPSVQAVKRWYDANPQSELLVVGHTDTSGQDSYNEQLSLERARSMAAFLTDDVEGWRTWYGSDKSFEKRWGRNEDGLMIESLAVRHGFGLEPNAVLSYQQWHNALPPSSRPDSWARLDEDGDIGPDTRGQLIGDYMNHDDTTLPADVRLTAHGCGEYFPLDRTGEEIDEAAADGAHDQTDRRVELFFFDGETTILPAPPGDLSTRGSQEYPEWRARAKEVRRFENRKVHVVIEVQIDHGFGYRLRAGGLVYRGDLAANGRIEHDVPLGDHEADLQVVDAETGGAYEWAVRLEALDAIDTIRGGQQRLENLGLYLGPPTGTEDDETRAAVTSFQIEQGITPFTGEYDGPTQQALTGEHDA